MVNPSARRQSLQVRLPALAQHAKSANLLLPDERRRAKQSAWEEIAHLNAEQGRGINATLPHVTLGAGAIGSGTNAGFVAVARDRAQSSTTATFSQPKETTKRHIITREAEAEAEVEVEAHNALRGESSDDGKDSNCHGEVHIANRNKEPPAIHKVVGDGSRDFRYFSPRAPKRARLPEDKMFVKPGEVTGDDDRVKKSHEVIHEARKHSIHPKYQLNSKTSNRSDFLRRRHSHFNAKVLGTLNKFHKPMDDEYNSNMHNFADIVDIDEMEAYEDYISETLCIRLLEHPWVRNFLLIVIISNTILIGLQTDETLEKKYSRYLTGLDTIFLIVFVVEIILKWYNGFFTYWRVGWNVFDFVIVASSLFETGLTFMSSARALHVLRMFRAFRTLRSINMLQGFQVIVNTLIESLPDMVNVMMLLGIIMFIFSVVGVDMFGDSLPADFGTMSIRRKIVTK